MHTLQSARNEQFPLEMYLIESPFPVIRLIFHKRKTNPQDYFHLFSLQIPNTFWDGKSTKKEWVIELKKQNKNKTKDPCEITAHFIA